LVLAFFLALPVASHFHLLCSGLSLGKHGWLGISCKISRTRLWPSGKEIRRRKSQTAGLWQSPAGSKFQGQREEQSRITEPFCVGALLSQMFWVSLQAEQMSTYCVMLKRTNDCTNG
jgi:hypothetical protein